MIEYREPVTRYVAFDDMNPAPYNPRKKLEAGDEEYESLKQSMDHFGYVEFIVWNEATRNVVGGHQKMQVLKDEGQAGADVVVVHMEDPNEEKALNLALNKISGRWDMDRLGAVLRELQSADLADLTGFSQREIDKFTAETAKEAEQIGEIDVAEFQDAAFEHQCPKCGYRWNDVQ